MPPDAWERLGAFVQLPLGALKLRGAEGRGKPGGLQLLPANSWVFRPGHEQSPVPARGQAVPEPILAHLGVAIAGLSSLPSFTPQQALQQRFGAGSAWL